MIYNQIGNLNFYLASNICFEILILMGALLIVDRRK